MVEWLTVGTKGLFRSIRKVPKIISKFQVRALVSEPKGKLTSK